LTERRSEIHGTSKITPEPQIFFVTIRSKIELHDIERLIGAGRLTLFTLFADDIGFWYTEILFSYKKHPASGKRSRNMKADRIKSLVVGFAVCAAVMLTFNCAKTPDEKAYVSFSMGDVTVKRGADSHAAQLKDVLSDGDLIITGDKSFVVIQLPGGALCRIEKNTSVTLSSVLGKEKNVTLHKGVILSKIEKLGKGEKYNVKTPLAIAAVRGTEFMTAYDGTSATVSVGDGKVNVINVGAEGESPADEGKTVVVSDSSAAVETRDVNNEESAELDKLKPVEYYPRIENMSDEELREAGKKLIVNESISEQARLSLDKIRKKYDRIDTVTLYSGKVIRGAIVSRGKVFRIDTPLGMIEIESKNIRRTWSN